MQPDNTPRFFKTQHTFTQYIRNPDNAPIPTDIEARRMNIYRDLLFDNISGVIGDTFPVLKEITSEDHWVQLCRDFFNRHTSQSPYFSEISQEFIQYLQTERPNNEHSNQDFPFLVELAHYEWAELFVTIAEEDNVTPPKSTERLNQTLALASTAINLAYQYPVHNISPDFIPTAPSEHATYLVVYRNIDNEAVFLETNSMTYSLLDRLFGNTKLTNEQVLSALADDMQHPNPDVVIKGGLSIIEDFITRGIIISSC